MTLLERRNPEYQKILEARYAQQLPQRMEAYAENVVAGNF